jgi:hypothetical protein
LLAGCGRFGFGEASADAPGGDAAPASGPWNAPTLIDLGLPSLDDPSMTADGLELFCNQGPLVFVSTRAAPTDPWPAPTQVTSLPSPFFSPHISDDGLTLWGANGVVDIVVTTRSDRTDSFGPTTTVTEVSSPATDDGPAVTSDGLVMVFDSNPTGSTHLYLSSRAAVTLPWSTPALIAELAVTTGARPDLSVDKLTIYFEAMNDLYFAQRATIQDPFGAPQLIPELSPSTTAEFDPWISIDQHHMLFASSRTGDVQLYEAAR